MKSIRDIYKIGKGPSSSHTMGPERAARLFRSEHPEAEAFRVILYGSLSKTGVGHGTDRVLRQVLSPLPTEIIFSDEVLPDSHPNTLDFIALRGGEESGFLRVESVGGGDIRIPGRKEKEEVEEVRWMDYEECHRRILDGSLPNCIYEDEFRMVGEYLKTATRK